jgi:FKBP-type peptidyl-prolyl cis-trans isomerase FklB
MNFLPRILVVGGLVVVWLGTAPLAAQPATEIIAAPAAATDAAKLDTPEGRLGYALGLRIGGRIAADFKAQKAPLDPAALARGLADAVVGAPPRLDEKAITQALESFEARMREQERDFANRMAEVAKANKVKAAEFMKQNATKQGVTTLPSGLQYEVLKAGAGAQPKPDDTVSTHYRGTHVDGTEFDATDPKGEPATFPLRGVVPGWQEALPLMKVGSKWKLYVPPALGYGEEGSPPVIEPNEVLVFEIELVKIASP